MLGEIRLLEGAFALHLSATAQQDEKKILGGNKPSSGMTTTNLSIYRTLSHRK